MRERVLQRLRPGWVRISLGLGVGGGVVAALAIWGFLTSGSQTPSATPVVAPQAAVSTISANPEVVPPAAATAVGTSEPSPFAGITEVPAPVAHRTAPVIHTVAADEVLWQIAEQYGLRPETVLWANEIDNPDLLLVGQQLTILPQDGVLYTVRPDDHLADIAFRYGVDVSAIVSANNLSDANQIQAGVDIFLPGARPLMGNAGGDVVAPAQPEGDQAVAASGVPVALPDNIEALLDAGWLRAQQQTDLYKNSDSASPTLHQLPGSTRLERLDGFRNGRILVRDPGDGHTRQAMTGWVKAVDLDVGRAPASRELPLAYPADTAMDISHVFAPYRSQLDGSPYSEANCGPTAVGMVLDAFGIAVPSRQLRAEALDAQHMYGNGVGTLITALASVVERHGLTTYDLRVDGGLHRWSLDDIRAQIRIGHPVVVQVRYRSLPGRGGALYFGDHYIVVSGVVGDGFLYNDPIDIDGLGWDRVMSGDRLRTAMNASAGQYAYTAFGVGR